MLLRQVPGAKPRKPTPEVAETVAAVRRYFEGEETDFSRFKLDLGEPDPFFERIYAAARRVGWGRTTTYGALAKELGAGPEAARDVGQAMAKNPVALIIPVTGYWRREVRLVVFPRQAARRQDPHARARGCSRRAGATGTAIFRVLRATRPPGTADPGIVEQPARAVAQLAGSERVRC
jgi:alkylated DNA nucleotide flippase Atl1